MEIPESHAGVPVLDGAEFAADPARFYSELRLKYGSVAPVLLEGGVPAWLVLGYRDFHYVTGNPHIFPRNSRHWNLWDQVPPDWPLMSYVAPVPGIFHTEGEEHRKRSGVISDAIEATDRLYVARVCERTADQLIDVFIGDGSADLIADYAQQLPIRVIAMLYGLPEQEAVDMTSDIALMTSGTAADAPAAAQRLVERIAGLMAKERERPGSGIAGRMVKHPAGLSDEDLAADMYFMVMVGQQPLADWIANTLRLMLVDDQFSLTLQGGRSSVGQALNQVLWESSPVQNMFGRWAAQDYVLGGRHISKGDMLLLSIAAANADSMTNAGPAWNSGGNRAHMAFAHGEHSCPAGAPEMAESIARTAIEVLLDRVPGLELAVPPEDLRWKPALAMRALEALPVTFGLGTRGCGAERLRRRCTLNE